MCDWEDISGCSGINQESIKYAGVWDYHLKIEGSKMWFPHVVEAVQNQVFITVSTSRGIPYNTQQFRIVSERICSAAYIIWYYQCSEVCPSGEDVNQLITIKKKK